MGRDSIGGRGVERVGGGFVVLAETEEAQDAFLEHAEGDEKTGGAAEQKLQQHAAGARVGVGVGQGRRGEDDKGSKAELGEVASHRKSPPRPITIAQAAVGGSAAVIRPRRVEGSEHQ